MAHFHAKRWLTVTMMVLTLTLLAAKDLSAGSIQNALLERMAQASPMERIPVLIYLHDQVNLDEMEISLRQMVAPGERVPIELRYRTILTALQEVAERTQPAVLSRLQAYEADGSLVITDRFWIRNILVGRATASTILELSSWPELGTIYLDGELELDEPVYRGPGESNPEAAEPGLRVINAHRLWELGYRGTGRLAMNIDTGVFGNNLAFNTRWRGTVPGVRPTWAWHDPSGGTTFPTDCDGHGTHTMGTMVGLYQSTNDTLGVAPSARWIASNSLCGGSPHTSRSVAAFQWAANPDSNIATMDDVPDVISCSWHDPNSCSDQCNPSAAGYGPVITAVEALGTAVVFSAGNGGPGASTVTCPKNRIASAVDIYAVGAIDGHNPSYPIASFSSRGPSVCAGPDSLRIKPEVVAPGVNVRSAASTSGFATFSGTSMAAPHVAGAIMLLREAAPFMTGTELKYLLMATATDLGTPGEDNTYGHGLINLWAAYQQLPLSMGRVRGQVTSGGNPLSGVQVDFVENVLQLGSTTGANGMYLAGARIDTPQTQATYTLRARKFAYVPYMDTVTVVLGDTVTRNIVMVPATLVLVRDEVNFPQTAVNKTRRDSVTARNGGSIVLNITSMTTTNSDFAVTPTNATLSPGDSMRIYIDYRPTAAGADTGRVIILSNAPEAPRRDIMLSGTGVATPVFTASVDSLVKVLEGGVRDSIVFRVRNAGTASGQFNARAVMYPRFAGEASGKPRYIPLSVRRFDGSMEHNAEVSRSVLLVSDNPGVARVVDGKGADPDPQFSIEGVSSSRIYRALVEAGYSVDSVAFATHNPATYDNYDLVIWSAGANTVTMFNDAAKRAALVNRVNNGGKVWVEGGEVGWFYRWQSTGGLDPLFRRVVLHCSSWVSDVTSSNLTFIDPAHPIFTEPNQIQQPVMFTGTGFGPRDAMRLIPGDVGARKIAGWTPQYPDTAGLITWEDEGVPRVVFTAFAFGSIVDTNAAKHLAQNIANWLVGSMAPWLSIEPRTGTVAVNDSITMVAGFDTRDASIYTDPGNYYGHIEVRPVGSPLADTLRVPTRMLVLPAASARLTIVPDSLNFGEVEIDSSRTLSVLARNIGAATLVVTGMTMTNPHFSVTPASFTLPFDDTLRLYITFTAPSPGAIHTGTMSFVSNDPLAPTVGLRGRSVGVAHIGINPTTFMFGVPPGPDTTTQVMRVINPGTDVLNYRIEESLPVTAMRESMVRSMEQQSVVEQAKDGEGGGGALPVTDGQGGPDAFGYIWIDSDEPGGPTFNWVDIRPMGTAVTLSDDQNLGPFPLGFTVNFYGNTYNSIRICSNGFLSFTSTATAFTNAAIPTAAEPNNALYGFWDDLNPATAGGEVHYYADAANNRFIVQFTNVARFNDAASRMTFQMIVKANGEFLYQYLTMTGTTNSATIGIENANGTIALQVVYNQPYVHNNLAVLFTRDLIPWMSVVPSEGTVAVGDTAMVAVRVHPGAMAAGTYQARLRVSGDTPDTVYANVTMDILVGVGEGEAMIPTAFGLEQNYPNPFNPTTVIKYALPMESKVTLRIYNILGQEVVRLVDGMQSAGYHEAVWNSRSSSGLSLASGIYFYRMDATPTDGSAPFSQIRKMILLK